MSKKLKRLSNFDFSVPGAHVALVDKAANGVENFLVIKSLATDALYMEMEAQRLRERQELEDKASKVVVELPLADMLVEFGLWRETALKIAAAVKKSESEAEDEIIESLQSALISLSSAGASGASDTAGSPAFLIAKRKEEANMSDTQSAPDTQNVDVQAVLKAQTEMQAKLEAITKANETLQEKVQAFEVVEKAREQARAIELVKKYETLGLTEEDATNFQALTKQEGFDKVIKALDAAIDLVSKTDLTKEVGAGGDTNTQETELEVKAKSIQARDGITFQQAVSKAVVEFPHLVSGR